MFVFVWKASHIIGSMHFVWKFVLVRKIRIEVILSARKRDEKKRREPESNQITQEPGAKLAQKDVDNAYEQWKQKHN